MQPVYEAQARSQHHGMAVCGAVRTRTCAWTTIQLYQRHYGCRVAYRAPIGCPCSISTCKPWQTQVFVRGHTSSSRHGSGESIVSSRTKRKWRAHCVTATAGCSSYNMGKHIPSRSGQTRRLDALQLLDAAWVGFISPGTSKEGQPAARPPTCGHCL